jgi:Bacterial protein of unknown function (DUF899)
MDRCLLLGVKRTSAGHASMSAFDPPQTSAFETCCAARSWLKPFGASPPETSNLSRVDRRARRRWSNTRERCNDKARSAGTREDWLTKAELGAPKVVDRSTFQAALDALRVREKAHAREGDAIAAARRRQPQRPRQVAPDHSTPSNSEWPGPHRLHSLHFSSCYACRCLSVPAQGWALSSRIYRRLVSDSFFRSDQRSLQNVFVEILSHALQDARVG